MHKFKNICLIVIFLLSLISFIPQNVYAAGNDMEADKACIANNACKNKSSVLGNVECECSTAYLLQKLLNYIRIIAPTLVVILSSVDYAKAVIASDEEDMKKVNKKLVTRLVLCVVLFIIPSLIDLLLRIFGLISSDNDILQGLK